jgi:hypothetical protein
VEKIRFTWDEAVRTLDAEKLRAKLAELLDEPKPELSLDELRNQVEAKFGMCVVIKAAHWLDGFYLANAEGKPLVIIAVAQNFARRQAGQ